MPARLVFILKRKEDNEESERKTPPSLSPTQKESTHTRSPNATYLSRRVPNLRLDDLPIPRLDALGRKLHANRTLALQVELVAGEPRQEVGLPDA